MEKYSDYIGDTFEFQANDKIPQWIFKCEVAHFGTDVIVIPEIDKVVIKSGTPVLPGQSAVEIRNYNGEQYFKTCPEIHIYGINYCVANDGTVTSLTRPTVAKIK